MNRWWGAPNGLFKHATSRTSNVSIFSFPWQLSQALIYRTLDGCPSLQGQFGGGGVQLGKCCGRGHFQNQNLYQYYELKHTLECLLLCLDRLLKLEMELQIWRSDIRIFDWHLYFFFMDEHTEEAALNQSRPLIPLAQYCLI